MQGSAVQEPGPAVGGPASIVYGTIHKRPDALDPRTPPPPPEDDRGLPPVLRGVLSEVDPAIAIWRPAFMAETMARYHQPDVLVLTAEAGTSVMPAVDYDLKPLPVEEVPRQPHWAEDMERTATPDDEVTQHLKAMDKAETDEHQRRHRWWPWSK